VVWRGRLPAHEAGSFPVVLRLPRKTGDYAFPAYQTCPGETAGWTERAATGAGPHALLRPAPVLKIGPRVRRAGNLTVGEAIVSPTRGTVPTNAVYLTVYNGGQEADRLLGAASPDARSVMLHVTETEGGIARMKAAAGLAVPPQAATVLAPGGAHLMVTGPARPLRVGQRLPLTLRFQRTGAVRIEAVVAEPPLPEAGGGPHHH
jgi:copper(I)-binding protein